MHSSQQKPIVPTVGRIVHYWHTDLTGPLPALICYVHPDGSINVAVFDHNGYLLRGGSDPRHQFLTSNVRLVQPGESPSPSNPYCTWPSLVPDGVICLPGKPSAEVDITDKPSAPFCTSGPCPK